MVLIQGHLGILRAGEQLGKQTYRIMTKNEFFKISGIAIISMALFSNVIGCKPKLVSEFEDGSLVWQGLKNDKNQNRVNLWDFNSCIVVTPPLEYVDFGTVKKNDLGGYEIDYAQNGHPGKISLKRYEYAILRASGSEVRSYRGINIKSVLEGNDFEILLK